MNLLLYFVVDGWREGFAVAHGGGWEFGVAEVIEAHIMAALETGRKHAFVSSVFIVNPFVQNLCILVHLSQIFAHLAVVFSVHEVLSLLLERNERVRQIYLQHTHVPNFFVESLKLVMDLCQVFLRCQHLDHFPDFAKVGLGPEYMAKVAWSEELLVLIVDVLVSAELLEH